MLPTLPDKYYLTHANELFDFVNQHCSHLLDQEQQNYLYRFEKLSTDAQCMLVRFLSRKPRFLKRESLQYSEIENPQKAIAELQDQHYISTVKPSDWSSFVQVLTKPQLNQCLSSANLKIKSSTPKANLTALAQGHFIGDEPSLFLFRENYLVRRQQDTVDYILFIFFGDLKNRFQKFAMRDLGVLSTRSKARNLVARFGKKEQALSAFECQKLHRELSSKSEVCYTEMAQRLLEQKPIGEVANAMHSKLLLNLGDRIKQKSPTRAITLWKASLEPLALERWIRLSYTCGDRDKLKSELETLRLQQLSAPSKIFIEDYYSRKYQGKRTSIYTDMLREAAHQLEIDEAFINEVENGVAYHYRQKNVIAFFTENILWRVLFAFTFWDLLFAPNQPQHCEFDRLPLGLKFGQFYSSNGSEIEACLASLTDPVLINKRFMKLASEHYGYPTGLFKWTPNLLEMLSVCVNHSPPNTLCEILRQMAMDYQNCKDGYPDLMIIEQGKLRFEEIKAPGDVLRPNQLLSIKRLRDAGFCVDVAQVNWTTDPNQVYAVVDIETTGGSKGLHSITEIAVVKVRNHKIISQWSTLVNPQRPIPGHITRLTGIDNQMVSSAPIFSEVADQLLEELAGCIFVAHNVGFDYGFIKAALDGLNRHFHMPKFCTVSNSRKTFPGLKSYALGKLTRHFDIDLNTAHRALEDAQATAELLVLIQQARASNGLPQQA